jgi:S-adenosylmethionine-diacylgycerolhomoserine-N-methlytransferase
MENTDNTTDQVKRIQNFYRLHARLYEATRWTFLFGRRRMLDYLHLSPGSEKMVLEVGCGTGHNLHALARRHPQLQLRGVDVSPDMLEVAGARLRPFISRVRFLEMPYAPGSPALGFQPDIILFSYCLTMINPGWEAALQRAYENLAPGGRIAVVDFHGSSFGFFQHWMKMNHVRMDEHLLPALEKQFAGVHKEVRRAYGGLWTYFLYVGIKY